MKLWQKCNLNLESFFIVSDNLEFQIENPLNLLKKKEQMFEISFSTWCHNCTEYFLTVFTYISVTSFLANQMYLKIKLVLT